MTDSVATPEEFKLPDPSTVDPFMKLTVPDAAAVPVALTVATRLRADPAMTVLGDATRLVVVVALEAVTVTDAATDVLDPKLVVPRYRAVRLYVPTGRDVTESVATPEEFTLPDPSTVDPFMKLTVPDSDELPLALTVATRLRADPATTELGDATRLVVVVTLAAVTVTEAAAEVLEPKLEFPTYREVRLYVPAGRDVTDSVATPEEFTLPDPSTVDPFMKLTAPVGDALPLALTVATRLSACPAMTGFGDATRLILVAETTCKGATADWPAT